MKKRIKWSFLVIFLLTVFALPLKTNAAPTEGKCGTYVTWKWDSSSKTLRFTGISEDDEDNKMYNRQGGNYGYDDYKNVVEHLVFDKVAAVGQQAFINYTNVKDVTFVTGGNLKTSKLSLIDKEAFKGCTGIKEIKLDYWWSKIEESAFEGCTNLEKANLEGSIVEQTIAKKAFYNCTKLANIDIYKSIKSLGEDCFTTGYTDSEGYSTEIKYWATSKDLLKVTFGNTSNANNWRILCQYRYTDDGLLSYRYINGYNGNIEIRGFASSINKEAQVTIPSEIGVNKVTKIADNAFAGETILVNVTIPDSVTEIGNQAFYNCTELKKVTLSKNLKTIGDMAFCNDHKLNMPLELPASLEKIGVCAFKAVPLQTIDLSKASKLKVIPEEFNQFNNNLSKLTFNDNIKKIDTNAFAVNDTDYGNLKQVNLPESLETIGSSAFYGRKGITDITIPANVTEIGESAFEGCIGLKKVYINSVKLSTIYAAAFRNCSSIIEVFFYGFEYQWHNIKIQAYNTNLTSAKLHTYEYDYSVKKPATTSADGILVHKCTVKGCSDTLNETIPKIASVSLSKKSLEYNGKEKKPTVTVKDRKGNKLVEGTDYTLSFASGRIVPGKYSVIVTFKDKYEGQIKYTYTIEIKPVTNLKVANTASGIKISWTANKNCDGYLIYQGSKQVKKLEGGSKKTVTITKDLKNGSKYNFKVIAYCEGKDGKIYKASSASATVCRVNATSISSLTSTKAKKATVKWEKVSKATGYEITYDMNSNFKTAKTVTVKGEAAVSKTLTGLTSKKNIYVKVRAYREVSGTKYYSVWSPVKSVKVK